MIQGGDTSACGRMQSAQILLVGSSRDLSCHIVVKPKVGASKTTSAGSSDNSLLLPSNRKHFVTQG